MDIIQPMASRAKTGKASAAAESSASLLRRVPPVDECLKAAEQDGELCGLSRDYLKIAVHRAIAELRTTIAAGAYEAGAQRGQMMAQVIGRVRAAAANDESALKPVVNATGVVLHTNLGRALLAEAAIEAVERAARSAVNLEYDLETGGRGDRDKLVEEQLCALTGAEAATVVNNNAAAVLLVLNTLAEGREVVVSRGELVEIGGSFRLPEVMARSGALIHEVGTTNRTHPGDYRNAIGPTTALLLKVHPSNYRVVGFTSAVELGELAEIGREHGVEVIEDLGSGALIDLSIYGLPHEPVVRERIAAGAAIVTFSGDKLLGGPQAGIAVGRRALIDRLKGNPLKRALRCDKLTIAALEATLRLYLRSRNLGADLPTLRLMRRSTAEIGMIAVRAREILIERLGPEFRIEIVDSMSQIGSGALPTEELQTRALRITHRDLSEEAISTIFRGARPPVLGRMRDGAFMLDLRTVENAADLAVEFPRQKT
jgi:L-seryl-tRNA(Ser) seleniumtransferase